MQEQDNATPDPKDGRESAIDSIGKHLAGTALLTAAGAAGGMIYGAIKKSELKTATAIGAGIGLLSSVGFGKDVCNAATRALHGKRQSHVERLATQRATSTETHQR